MEKKRRLLNYVILIFGILLITTSLIFLSNFVFAPSTISPSSTLSEKSKVISHYCPSILRADGTLEEDDCVQNTVYDIGLDSAVEDLAGLDDFNFTTILLCNATAGCAAGADIAFNTYLGCGLNPINASLVADIAGTGNVTIYGSWTVTCDSQSINATKLQDINGLINLSGADFTTRTANNNDEFRMNITLEQA